MGGAITTLPVFIGLISSQLKTGSFVYVRGRTQDEKWRELRVVLTPFLAKPLCARSERRSANAVSEPQCA